MDDDALPLSATADSRDAALYRHWRGTRPLPPPTGSETAEWMALAAHIDGMPGDAEQAETALLRDPALLDFFLELRRSPPVGEIPSPGLLAAARALVPTPSISPLAEPETGPVTPNAAGARSSAGDRPATIRMALPRHGSSRNEPSRRSGRGWQGILPLGAMAASVALVAALGFDIGLHAQQHLSPAQAASSDIFDPQNLLQDNELG